MGSKSEEKKRIQVLVTADQEARLKDAARRAGYENDLSGWMREAAFQRVRDEEIAPAPFNREAIRTAVKVLGEYAFRLEGIEVTITIRLFDSIPSGRVWWSQSHHLHTPSQAGPYMTSRPFGDDADVALRSAVSGFVQFYDAAIRAGHEPNESWLVPNDRFPLPPL